MSWAYDVNGYPTWVPWIVGEPSANQVPKWDGAKWAPGSTSGASYVKTRDPLITDDTGSGYIVGDLWVNTTGGRTFEAVSVTAGAALWRRMGGPASALTTDGGTVALWTLAGNANDSGGGGYNLTVAGTEQYAYAIGGRQVLWESSGASTYTQANAALRLTSTMSVEFLLWVTPNGSYQTFVQHGDVTLRRYFMDLNNSAYAAVNWGYCYSAGNVSAVSSNIPHQGWNYIVCDRTVSGGNTTLNIYVNGTLAVTATNATTPSDASATTGLYLMQSAAGANYPNLAMCGGIHVSTSVMTANTIKQRAQLMCPDAGVAA